MLNPKGRVIMVSGTSRGIGRAIAENLIGKGYSLSLGVRNPDSVRRRLASATDAELLVNCRLEDTL